MEIYVKDEEMPKSCESCWLRQHFKNEYFCDFAQEGWVESECETGRLRDCPLKPLSEETKPLQERIAELEKQNKDIKERTERFYKGNYNQAIKEFAEELNKKYKSEYLSSKVNLDWQDHEIIVDDLLKEKGVEI